MSEDADSFVNDALAPAPLAAIAIAIVDVTLIVVVLKHDPVVDEDEELVLEANEASVVVQNLSELAISVDAALDGDAVSVVESSLASSQACIVCFEKAMEAACIPCGHRCLCIDCADRFRHPGSKCPVCREPLVLVCKIWG